MLWDLSRWENLPQQVNCGFAIAPGKIVGRNLEQSKVEA